MCAQQKELVDDKLHQLESPLNFILTVASMEPDLCHSGQRNVTVLLLLFVVCEHYAPTWLPEIFVLKSLQKNDAGKINRYRKK